MREEEVLARRLDMARKFLARREYADTARFRGLPLSQFDADELRKIVEIALEHHEREVLAHRATVGLLKALGGES